MLKNAERGEIVGQPHDTSFWIVPLCQTTGSVYSIKRTERGEGREIHLHTRGG